MSKPPFDPSQPFQAADSAKPAFDPSQPFTTGDQEAQQQIEPQQPSGFPMGPDMSAIKPEGSNPASMALSAAAQTFGVQPTTASTPQGAALQAVQNQVMAPARLSQTLGGASGPASEVAENLMKQAGTGPFMQKAAGLLTATAVDPRSYVMPGGDVSITPENLPGAKFGEMLSGTPSSNLDRAYKGGLYKTYIAPQGIKKSGKEFGDAFSNAVSKNMTPEERAAVLINPKGEANQKIADVYTQWLKGSPISTQDAVGAKVAIGTVFPTATAKNASKIAKLSEFEHELTALIEKDPSPEAQAFKKANQNYAASALRSNLSKPMPVNKSNPQEYSKLARYLAQGVGLGGAVGGHGAGPALGAVATLLGTSPLAMGTLAAGAGSVGRGANSLVNNPAIQALFAKYLENRQGNVR